MPDRLSRRQFLQTGALLAAGIALPAANLLASDDWHAGELAHLLPAASHERFLIKASFRTPLAEAPRLSVNGRSVAGQRTDTAGKFWRFDAAGLKSDTVYTLQILGANGRALCATWPLKTFPLPDATPERVRLLVYTCAGGNPDAKGPGGMEAFRSLAIRHALLERGLSYRPDVVIANGDHVYQDQRTWLESASPTIRKAATDYYNQVGMFDTSQAVLGTANEPLLKKMVDPQIAHLYGTRLRSTPVFFLMDDHDYFENDEAEENFITFPPDNFDLTLARTVQDMYFPEFLPERSRSLILPGSNAADRAAGVSECFGTLRYGKLLEMLMYDCGRYLSLKDRHAGLVPPEAEKWLLERTRGSDARHMIHMPSTPFGWSAGKWREWYPDVVVSDEIMAAPPAVLSQRFGSVRGTNMRLSTARQKYMWQSGWFGQHQRIVAAMAQQRRPAVMMSGDLHATGWDRMTRSGDIDLRANPMHIILNGPLGTGMAGWPSGPRGLGPGAPDALTLERNGKPMEKNGFSIVDITPERMVCQLFAWREPDPFDAISRLEPYDVLEIPRG
jgi:hypothetical protein